MTRNGNGPVSRWRLGWLLLRSGFTTVTSHWALAGFSLIVAFGIWLVVQDVENPRVQALVPPDPEPPSIRVEVANNNQDFIVDDPGPVQVKVEGRKGDLTGLRPEDFKAQVDVRGLSPGEHIGLPVKITSQPNGVRVIEVKPAAVTVTIHQATTKEVRVSARIVAPLPAGYSIADEPTIDPVSVKVRGIPELVDSVVSVEVDANLAGARGDTASFEGDLVARTSGDNAVTVSLSATRARVTFKIQQDFVSRTLGFASPITGTPANGYRITGVTFDPPVVNVTGPKSLVDSLQPITLAAVNTGGAKAPITITRQIDKREGLIIDNQNVIVRVDIQPTCGDQASDPCPGAIVVVQPELKPPAGLVVDTGGVYSVQVRVTGPIAAMTGLKANQIAVAVNFTGATAGTNTYPVRVTSAPPGITADADPIAVTLRASP